jgi:integrase/recombinase XerD
VNQPLSTGAEEYLSWLAVEKGRSRNTLAAYRRDIAAWEHWAGDAGVDPLGAGPDAIERYLAELRGGGRNPASVARSTTALRGLYRVFGKGAKERLVPLGGPARFSLDRWLSASGRPCLAPARWARRSDSEAVFLNTRGGRLSRQGAWAIVSHRAEQAGLGTVVSPHVLRHSCASHMLAHGADIRVVQELLGHVSIATTQIYTKLSQEHLRNAYEQAHPRAGGVRAR